MIQLDMSKAFDKIGWEYVRQVLEAFAFLKDNIKVDHGNGIKRILLHPHKWFPFATHQSYKGHQARRSYLSLPLCHHG